MRQKVIPFHGGKKVSLSPGKAEVYHKNAGCIALSTYVLYTVQYTEAGVLKKLSLAG